MRQALESAKLWEARYEAVERSRQDYRENTRKLITENEGLHSAVHQVSLSAARVCCQCFIACPMRSGMPYQGFLINDANP